MATIPLQPHSVDCDDDRTDLLSFTSEPTATASVAYIADIRGTSVLPASSGQSGPVISALVSGNQDIDGLLTGVKWAAGTISYSSPDAAGDYLPGYVSDQDGDGLSAQDEGFSMLRPQQMVAAQSALDGPYPHQAGGPYAFSVEGFTNLGFQDAGSGTGEATIHLANTSDARTAYTFYPNASDSGGDVWLGPSGASPVAGNYDWFTVLHELGHSLGLKHGHEGAFFGALPGDVDSMEFSVMTYKSYVDASPYAGYTNGAWDYAQTYMMLDVAALQYMYGADYTINAGDTVYRWSPASGQTIIDGLVGIDPGGNRTFATIWDGGGTDTYDLSAYTTGVNVDLHPGGYSTFSSDQLAQLGNDHAARGNIFNALAWDGDSRSFIENAIGGSGDDTLAGNAVDNALSGGAGNDTLIGDDGNDRLNGGSGADRLYGGAGNDTLVYDASDSRVDGGSGIDTLVVTGSGVAVDLAGRAGTTLTGVEIIDLSGGGNSLALRLTDVLPMVDVNGTLRIDGSTANAVSVADAQGAVQGTDQVIGAHTYHTYTQGSATLLVDTDISTSIMGLGSTTAGTGDASPNHTRVTDGNSSITDNDGHVWTLAGQAVYVDGSSFNWGWGNMLLWEDGIVYHRSPATGDWFYWNPDAQPYPWVDTGTSDPETRLTPGEVLFAAPNDSFANDSVAQADTAGDDQSPTGEGSVPQTAAEGDGTGMAAGVMFALLHAATVDSTTAATTWL